MFTCLPDPKLTARGWIIITLFCSSTANVSAEDRTQGPTLLYLEELCFPVRVVIWEVGQQDTEGDAETDSTVIMMIRTLGVILIFTLHLRQGNQIHFCGILNMIRCPRWDRSVRCKRTDQSAAGGVCLMSPPANEKLAFRYIRLQRTDRSQCVG